MYVSAVILMCLCIGSHAFNPGRPNRGSLVGQGIQSRNRVSETTRTAQSTQNSQQANYPAQVQANRVQSARQNRYVIVRPTSRQTVSNSAFQKTPRYIFLGNEKDRHDYPVRGVSAGIQVRGNPTRQSIGSRNVGGQPNIIYIINQDTPTQKAPQQAVPLATPHSTSKHSSGAVQDTTNSNAQYVVPTSAQQASSKAPAAADAHSSQAASPQGARQASQAEKAQGVDPFERYMRHQFLAELDMPPHLIASMHGDPFSTGSIFEPYNFLMQPRAQGSSPKSAQTGSNTGPVYEPYDFPRQSQSQAPTPNSAKTRSNTAEMYEAFDLPMPFQFRGPKSAQTGSNTGPFYEPYDFPRQSQSQSQAPVPNSAQTGSNTAAMYEAFDLPMPFPFRGPKSAQTGYNTDPFFEPYDFPRQSQSPASAPNSAKTGSNTDPSNVLNQSQPMHLAAYPSQAGSNTATKDPLAQATPNTGVNTSGQGASAGSNYDQILAMRMAEAMDIPPYLM